MSAGCAPTVGVAIGGERLAGGEEQAVADALQQRHLHGDGDAHLQASGGGAGLGDGLDRAGEGLLVRRGDLPALPAVLVVRERPQEALAGGRDREQRLRVEAGASLQRHHVAVAVVQRLPARADADEEPPHPLRAVGDGRDQRRPAIRERPDIVGRRHDPRRDEQREARPGGDAQHLRGQAVGAHGVARSPCGQRPQDAQPRGEHHRREQEDDERERGLSRQVGDVGEKQHARRQQRHPRVAPAHDGPRAEERDQPH